MAKSRSGNFQKIKQNERESRELALKFDIGDDILFGFLAVSANY